ncbi:MAG TPA: peptidoglycan recognition family protein, partial [Terrimesophilobacter sp.]|nr:peptidoglycan recognition family protein [Terrimesophilobacter sp.]
MQTIRTNKTNRSRPWGTTHPSNRRGIAIHHTVTPEGDSLESVEAIIDRHINGAHPYGSYNYVIDHAGRIWDIVGLDGVGAHAGGKNTPYLGVCYIGDGRYNFTEAARESFADMVAYLEQQCGKALEVVPHSALNATACPGDLIRNAIPTFREERARSGSLLTLEQGKQLAGWVGRGYHTREYVLDVQQWGIWRGYLAAH